MKLKELLEEFKDSFKFGPKYIEVFINPSKKEMSDASGKIAGSTFVRFIATTDKKFYVFDPIILHHEMAESLKISPNNGKKDFWAVAKKESGRWRLYSSDSWRPSYHSGSDMTIKKWGWMKKYIDFSDDGKGKIKKTWGESDKKIRTHWI